jgi:hypothetical protein
VAMQSTIHNPTWQNPACQILHAKSRIAKYSGPKSSVSKIPHCVKLYTNGLNPTFYIYPALLFYSA